MNLMRLLPLGAALALAYAPAVQAQSLPAVYEAARAHDASWQSAKLAYDAAQAKAAQAEALRLPTVNLSSTASRSSIDISTPSVSRPYGTVSAAIAASHPLYRPANRASYEQAMRALDVAQVQLQQANQELIVRSSQAYFDVLGAQESVAFVKAQKAAVAEQLASAKRNFEVGTSTITDTREAQARFDLVVAQELAAENDWRTKQLNLDSLTGRPNTAPLALPSPMRPPVLAPADMDSWVRQADGTNPSVAQARLAVDLAQLETEKARAGHLPTVDLVGNYSITRNDGSASSPLGSRTNLASVGVTLNVPLFAGYATQNRIRETLALEERARMDWEAARRAVAHSVRTAYLGVVSGGAQVKALEAAEASSQSALDANRLGYQVGVRINIDVLNSQSQLFQTKRDLAQARYTLLMGHLKLRQASGNLAEQDLATLSTATAK